MMMNGQCTFSLRIGCLSHLFQKRQKEGRFLVGFNKIQKLRQIFLLNIKIVILQIIFAQSCMKPVYAKRLTEEDIIERLRLFLQTYEDPSMEIELQQPYDRLGKYKYQIMMQKIANQKIKSMNIYIEDMQQILRKEEDKVLIEQIKRNVIRYLNFLYQIVDKIIPKRNVNINPEDNLRYELENALEKQRKQNLVENQFTSDNEKLPLQLHRKYQIMIGYKVKKANLVKSISELTSNTIGNLVILKGIVIKADEIKPKIDIATFTCDICGAQNYLQISNDHFVPMVDCQSKKCREDNINGKLTFVVKHSHFVSTQSIKIQQTPDQLKQGKIPRNLKITLTHDNVRKVQPGDIVEIQGTVVPKRKQGFLHEQDLIFDIQFEAYSIESKKKKYIDMEISQEDKHQIDQLRNKYNDQDLFKKLSQALAPEIYGLQFVKKALLLLLAGGVTATTHDKLKIRGQINIMLVGDPGVAKSQLLKHISLSAPRGIYTTGKGSSDVGLTAAVKIDPVTKDVSLEAGALVLADMGVCCIDEFDKMDEYDKTAIHEVMEQQTISIAKAGLTTTLNARTSILAAANPLYSRYNPKETPQKNINLPAALFSRFDLIFILLDKCDMQADLALAKHIGSVHKGKNSIKNEEFTPKLLKNYIALSKEFEPKINQEVTATIIKRYVSKRITESDRSKEGEKYITTRYLLALIRLCQARARLRFSNEISLQDIEECEEIINQSQKNVSNNFEEKKELVDDVTSIYNIIKQMWKYNPINGVPIDVVEKRVINRGFSMQILKDTLIHYELLNVLMVNKGHVFCIQQ